MTTYIKRVPPTKAVQFYVSKEAIMQLMGLLGHDWSWTIKGGNGSRVRITFENAKPVDAGKLVYVAEEGDWIVVFADGSLPQVMESAEFKAQYEAAPEAKSSLPDVEALRKRMMPDEEAANMTVKFRADIAGICNGALRSEQGTCFRQIQADDASSDEFLLIPRSILKNNGRDVWFPGQTPYLWNIEFKMAEVK